MGTSSNQATSPDFLQQSASANRPHGLNWHATRLLAQVDDRRSTRGGSEELPSETDREIERRGSEHGPPSVLQEELEQGDLFETLREELPGEEESQSTTAVPSTTGRTATTQNESGLGLYWLLIIIPILLVGVFAYLFWRRQQAAQELSGPVGVGPIDTSRRVEPMATLPATPLNWSEPTATGDVPHKSAVAFESTGDEPRDLEPEPIHIQDPFSRSASNATESTRESIIPSSVDAIEATSANSFAPTERTRNSLPSGLAPDWLAPREPTSASYHSDSNDSIASSPPLGNDEELNRLRTELAEAKQQLEMQATLSKELAEAHTALGASRARVDQLERHSHESYAAQQGLQQQLEQIRGQLTVIERQRDELQAQATVSPAVDKSQVEALRAQVEEATAARQQADAERERLQASMLSLQSELESGQATLAEVVTQETYAELENQYYTILEERDRLLSAQHAAAEPDIDLKAEIKSLQTGTAELQTEIKAVEATNAELRTEMEAVEATSAELRAEVDAVQTTNAELRREVEALQTTNAELRAEMEAVEAADAASNLSEESLKNALTVAEERIEAMSQDAATVRAQLTEAEKELGELMAAKKSSETYEARTREQLQHLETTISQQQETIERLNHEKEVGVERLYQASQRRDELDSLVQQLHASPPVDDATSELIELRAQLESIEAEGAAREQNAIKLEGQLELSYEEATRLREELHTLQTQFERVTDQAATYEDQNVDLRDELQTVRSDAATAHEISDSHAQTLVRLESQLSEKSNRVVELESAIQEKEEALRQFGSQSASIETTLSSLKAERDEAIRAHDEAEERIDSLRSERRESLDQLQSALQRAASLEATLRQTEAQLALADSEMESITSLKEEMRNQQARSQATIERLFQEQESSLLELHSLQREFQEVQVVLRETEQVLIQAQAENKAILDLSAKQADDQLSRLSAERDTAIRAWGAAEQRASEQQSKLRELEFALRRLETDNERLSRQLEDLENYRKQLEQSLSEADARLASRWSEPSTLTRDEDALPLQAELERMQAEVSATQREKQAISDRLEAAQTQLRRMESLAAEQERTLAELSNEREALQSMIDQGVVTSPENIADTRLTESTLRELRAALQDQEATVVKLQRELAEKSDELRREKSRPRPPQVDQSIYQMRLEQLERSLGNATNEIKQLKSSQQRSLTAAKSSNAEIAELQESLASSERARQQSERIAREAEQVTAAAKQTTRKTPTKKKSPTKKSAVKKQSPTSKVVAPKKKGTTAKKKESTTENGAIKKRTTRKSKK